MAKKTTKTEHDMQFVKPSTQPIINQKTQQKQKKKQPAVDEKNLQKTKIQKYKEEIKSIEKSIILPKKSIFSGAELKMTIKKQKKNKIVRVVSIRPILKDESFGKVVPISHEYNEGVSIDTIKKSALNALNKPSYDIELGTDKKKELSDKVIEMVKSSPDVVDDLDFTALFDWPFKGYFWLNYSIAYINPVRHDISDAVIDKDGNMKFTFYQNIFELPKNGEVKYTKKEDYKKIVEFINRNSAALKRCIELAKKIECDGACLKMNVSTTGFYAVLKFQKQQYKKHMSNVVDFDALEAWVDVMTDDYKKFEAELRERIEDRFRKLKIYGSMLHLVILKMIAEREGKEWPEQYLWIEDNISEEIDKVQNKMVVPMLSQKEIEGAVEDMVSCGLLVKKHKKMFAVKGEPFLPKAKNIELMVTDDYMIFAEMIYRDYGWIKGGNVVDVLRKDISEYNDFDWFAWAINGMNIKEDTAESDYLPLLEHRCIVLSFDEANEIGAFLVCRSDVWKDYALTMMEIAEDYGEKWYWKIVSECIGDAKKIGNIHESYMLSHGDRRLLVHEMKKKDAQVEDLGVDVDFDTYDDFADSDIEDIHDNTKQKIYGQPDDIDFDDYI
jgi:hypothetical protein